ncbi:hypothetical protein CSC67_10105 [Pusillimonas caeni]|uniref:hypothetical protein n=1 Tax=Pusillimonas caeni TaxID=1348472 RepID=UPI000E59A968|nr:hypothetical protein [Pusillimonas caeni]TFL13612.1 hypothetical protein CSC67_10105 [Pusillimonas caeni]
MTQSDSKDRAKAARAAREQASSGTKRPAHDESKRPEAEDAKATRFDGDPNPVGASRSAFKPQDDTPAVLDKKSGPRTGRA